MISILDRYSKAIISFNLDDFSNGQRCISYIKKGKGNGPDEFNLPSDIIFDEKRNLYYISDLLNYCIYVYNQDFFEIDRIKLKIRPYKIVISKKYLYVTPYENLNFKFMVEKIDLDSRVPKEGLLSSSIIGNELEKSGRNRIFLASINSDDSHFFLAKSYPNFNIYDYKNEKIVKVFTAPLLRNKRLPKPKFIIRENDRKVWGINSFSDFKYDNKDNLLFILTTNGWTELARKFGLNRYILIFNINGVCLSENKITPYEGVENSLCYDSKNGVLYYCGYSNIYKFKLEVNNNETQQ